MTEIETVEQVAVEETPVEAEPAIEFDIEKIQAAYDETRKLVVDGTLDLNKLSRMEYGKYLWLENKLAEAGLVGEKAWEEEFKKS